MATTVRGVVIAPVFLAATSRVLGVDAHAAVTNPRVRVRVTILAPAATMCAFGAVTGSRVAIGPTRYVVLTPAGVIALARNVAGACAWRQTVLWVLGAR